MGSPIVAKPKQFEVHADVAINVCETDGNRAQHKAMMLLSAVAEDVEIVNVKGETNDEIESA